VVTPDQSEDLGVSESNKREFDHHYSKQRPVLDRVKSPTYREKRPIPPKVQPHQGPYWGGVHCSHKSRYIVIKPGDHDIILGQCFLSYMAARDEGDDCWIPWPVALPQWVSQAHAPVKLLLVSRREMEEELQRKVAAGQEGEVYLLIPQRQLL
jgi:hypothetical protein